MYLYLSIEVVHHKCLSGLPTIYCAELLLRLTITHMYRIHTAFRSKNAVCTEINIIEVINRRCEDESNDIVNSIFFKKLRFCF